MSPHRSGSGSVTIVFTFAEYACTVRVSPRLLQRARSATRTKAVAAGEFVRTAAPTIAPMIS